ncbi:FAD-binding oxidoreductase [Luedemannella flava]|uniref:nitric oxide dioxygenase n=1 Tax=Luedemannella flava TaxID=349316 RepID=A0ABN2LTT8_9ACTN
MDVDRLRASWAAVAAHGAQVPSYFYSYLFIAHEEVRAMFPAGMSDQRVKLVTALGEIVSNVDQPERLVRFVEALGRDHRKFGAEVAHYDAVGEALIATLAHFLGEDWTPALADDWTAAFGVIARTMQDAAARANQVSPAFWMAEVVEHSRRNAHLAVITVLPESRIHYQPGQSVSVESHLRPKVWRHFSPANAPRRDGTIDLHVSSIPGGELSPALVVNLRKGDALRIGSPIGDRLTLPAEEDRDLLLIAGGSGLAPLKAVLEQVASTRPRPVTLVMGVRHSRDLYDLDSLVALAQGRPWLTVRPAVSHEPTADPGVELGDAVDVALRYERPRNNLITYVCGSDPMVRGTLKSLAEAGWPTNPDAVRHEDFDARGYRPSPAPAEIHG